MLMVEGEDKPVSPRVQRKALAGAGTVTPPASDNAGLPIPGNPQRPRETPGAGGGPAGGATPSQSSEPMPVAARPPAPITSTPTPSFMPMPEGMQPNIGRMLFGRAGGLLGGGLGVPGALGDEGGGDDLAAALAEIMRLAGGRG